ncbi:hypothetical protein [Allorhodopirellula solitaria]|uniref:Uncharacterized protein n=1 Tax=Allorhodopirellula solitaria TaxID=2527987 RepID=A0A5C5XU95_9BACT|nr:hypothetical protein [Allorhodopirellula solitaria]TWT66131.1 hypothetical protein CA85_29950 [Allorhodopirellula solitaria]
MKSTTQKRRIYWLLLTIGCAVTCGCGGPEPPPALDDAVQQEIVEHDEMVSDQESSM